VPTRLARIKWRRSAVPMKPRVAAGDRIEGRLRGKPAQDVDCRAPQRDRHLD
jgi:hypothetical protein